MTQYNFAYLTLAICAIFVIFYVIDPILYYSCVKQSIDILRN